MITIFLISTAVLLSVVHSNPLIRQSYEDKVPICLETYKSCAFGNNTACTECKSRCGPQEITTTNDNYICTLLFEYCETKEGHSVAGQCIEPKCISRVNSCREDPTSDECKYCSSSCNTNPACPEEYVECRPGSTPPPPRPGCSFEPCTYYRNLCYWGGSASPYCEYCALACPGIPGCDEQSAFCISQAPHARLSMIFNRASYPPVAPVGPAYDTKGRMLSFRNNRLPQSTAVVRSQTVDLCRSTGTLSCGGYVDVADRHRFTQYNNCKSGRNPKRCACGGLPFNGSPQPDVFNEFLGNSRFTQNGCSCDFRSNGKGAIWFMKIECP